MNFFKSLPFFTLIFAGLPQASAEEIPSNLQIENLAAWCIVPFDAKKRGPAERAQMLKDLGIRRSAYDWRNEHVAQFEDEILQYKKHGIEFFAFWGGHDKAYSLFEKYDLHPQIWRTLGSPTEGTQDQKVEAVANSMVEIATRTAELGCKLGLYNHGGWGGEPENMVAVCKKLREKGYNHVGIVYNWHHGHGHIEDWAGVLALMKPYLHCLNLNGMNAEAKPKILPLAQGAHELSMLKIVTESGYKGPIGILDHQSQLDSKENLQDNLDGLDWLKKELAEPGSGGQKPVPKAKPFSAAPAKSNAGLGPSMNEAFGKALTGGLVIEGRDEWRQPPITLECRVQLRDAKSYNILVASDTKVSAAHWEIFSMAGSGELTAYLPGASPDHVRSKKIITDNQWHAIAMQYAPNRVRLWVDGEVVADQSIAFKKNRKLVPGGLSFARLVAGGMGMRGSIDEVRIRKGIHEDLGEPSKQAFKKGAKDELGYWDFNDLEKLNSLYSPSSKQAPLFARDPLEPLANPYWKEPINRDRVYDFYAKQALHYGKMDAKKIPDTLPQFAGLDGGNYGHWGNQNDQDTWKDGRIREMDHGSMISGVFRGAGKTIPRAVSVSLGGEFNAVFNQDTLQYEAAWKGPLVKWSDVRRGFMHGIPMGGDGTVQLIHGTRPSKSAEYLGLQRSGNQVIFSYLDKGKKKFRVASVSDGKVVERDLEEASVPGKSQWPERIKTRGNLGKDLPYAIDTLTLPYDNPWNALFFVSGVDFLSESRIAICNIHGDVWICDVSGNDLETLTWKRYAAGLQQPLGLKVVEGVIHVMCRDQIVALHDNNGDDEADFYERISSAHTTAAGGHDFITGLQRDNQGRWYFASGNQGLCRVSADGKKLDVLGTGLRNPNGLGINPDGSVILTSVQEGTWTPASAVCDIIEGAHYGAGGPRTGDLGYVPPMLYLPRGVDNSSGGQAYIGSDQWGPVKGQWVHFSGGYGKGFLVLREVIDGRSQGAAIPLQGEFLSGSHRGRFSPYDGQLYVAGAQGWGNYGVEDGALQRVRYTGGKYSYPIGFETRDNGILLTFAEPQSKEVLNPDNWFAQQWNYGYSAAYGSPEYSIKNSSVPGHDRLAIQSVHGIDGQKKVFIEMPQLQPVHQLHLHFADSPRVEIFATLHRLGKAFTDFPGYERIKKIEMTNLPKNFSDSDPANLINACIACHHPTIRVVGPSFSEIRQRYANNPEGIVKWAMKPENKNPNLPPMPSFDFLGEKKLKIIAQQILSMGVN